MKNNKKIRNKRKIEKPYIKKKWQKRTKFYHNKGSLHFLWSIANKGDVVAGHDMTSHPAVNKTTGKPKRKYMEVKNPDPGSDKQSFINKKLRKDLKIHFPDTGNIRLTEKKKWVANDEDVKRIKKIDKNKI